MVPMGASSTVLALLCLPGVLSTAPAVSANTSASLSLLQVQATVVHDTSPVAWRRAAVAAAAIAKDTQDDNAMEASALSKVPDRMKYWLRWEKIQARSMRPKRAKSYLLYDTDIGGLNNIRLGWEAAGIIANITGRTLVLPPASRFYLIDYGGEDFQLPGRVPDHSFSKVEDFISLAQLRRRTRTLTFKEFLGEISSADPGLALPAWIRDMPDDPSASKDSADAQDVLLRHWGEFVLNHTKLTKTVNATTCNISLYDTDDPVVYSRIVWDEAGLTREDSRLFVCMFEPPDLEHESWQMSPNAVSLSRGGFVWHPEVFQLAAPIITDLGLFEYAALHARYGDLQYGEMKQEPDHLVEKWFASEKGRHLSPKGTVYISTDGGRDVIDAFRRHGIKAKWSEDYFNSTSSPIFHLLQQKDVFRIHQLKGPVEQLVCAFGRTFIGTGKSTFTSYINQLRFDVDAPTKINVYHTQNFTEKILAEIDDETNSWEQRGGRRQWAPVPSVAEALRRLYDEKHENEKPVEQLMLYAGRGRLTHPKRRSN